jgi:glutamate dehydrogenase (NADP+)
VPAPCRLNASDEARLLISNGCIGVAEGANMPTEQQGITHFTDAKLLFAPTKAANAGGVAISGLEMSQNIARFVKVADAMIACGVI